MSLHSEISKEIGWDRPSSPLSYPSLTQVEVAVKHAKAHNDRAYRDLMLWSRLLLSPMTRGEQTIMDAIVDGLVLTKSNFDD
jgi:hypothetical protein